MLRTLFLLPLLSFPAALAAPLLAAASRRQTAAITAVSAADTAAFKPFTFYASAAYCQPTDTLAWSCGANCDANPDFQPITSGGDGVASQFCELVQSMLFALSLTYLVYVGYDPDLDTVVVGHQGTNPEKMYAILPFGLSLPLKHTRSIPLVEDSDFFLDSLDPDLFPGIASSVQVHNGFRDSQARSAPAVLAAVQSALAQTGTTSVTVVGHSLGAAIALIDSLYLSLQLGTSVNVRTIGYGMPRVSVSGL
jgi:hypothetical protein